MSIRWDDPYIGIDWPITNPILSEKDKNAPYLREVEDKINFYYTEEER
jgi:dTDP-4-dehydrorhamnose 3,5-epimerase-like enzyme